jgi:hypothetical protein
METGSVDSDMGIGLALLFSSLTLVGAVVMYAAPGQVTKAWGFAAAMVAATLAVVVAQVYWR